MKVWTLVFVMSGLVAVNSQTCPSEHFSAVMTATVDQLIDDPTTVLLDDPELTYFKNNLKFRDADIQHTIDDAIQFFNNTYGLDFSVSSPNEKNERFFQNAKMSPFIYTPDVSITDNRWIRTGNTRSTCYLAHDGGFEVTFTGDQTLYGSYGGAEGKPVGMGNNMLYGYYIIDVCKQSPVIILRKSNRPIRTEPVDRNTIFTHDLYNQVLGYGNVYGIFRIYPDPEGSGKFRVVVRMVLTFPAQ